MNKFKFITKTLVVAPLTTMTIFSCAKKIEEVSSELPTRSLYVASGVCNSGTGITTFTAASASRVIYKTNTLTGNVDSIVYDYNNGSETALNNPTGIASIDATFMYVATENATTAGARKIEKLNKITKTKTTYFQDASALTATAGHVLRGIIIDNDSNILISKTIAVERANTSPARVVAGANPYVNNPAAACTSNSTMITSMAVMPPFSGQAQGKIIYAHQAVGQNDIGVISRSGYSVVGDCLDNDAPGAAVLSASLGATAVTISATAAPTAIVYVPMPAGYTVTGKLLVAYASSTVNTGSTINNAIVSYDVTESSDTAVVVNSPTVLYRDNTVIHGISAMAYDSTTNSLYVATATSTATTVVGYNIEKFIYDYATGGMTRVGVTPFQASNLYNKCISGMTIGE